MCELPNAEWLPCAHDPLHHFVIAEHGARPYDVAIIGAGYPQRAEVIEALRMVGVRVYATTGKIYDEYNAIYNSAKIALVVSSGSDLAMRVFENMAQGCIVVADDAPDIAKAGFVVGRDYLQYRSIPECIEHVRTVLAGYDSRDVQAIRCAAREAVTPHTWEARVKHILKAVK